MESSTTAVPVLITEVHDGVARVMLNRPEKRNALSWELLQALEAAQNRLADDRSACVVVVSAQGPAFSAGHDLGEMVSCSADDYRRLFALCSRVMHGFRRLPQPV